jgi:hypothetical protein
MKRASLQLGPGVHGMHERQAIVLLRSARMTA